MAGVESFDQIDTAAVDELNRINQEREVLRDRLAKVEQRRDKVSGEVFERVCGDYRAQISALDHEAQGPLSRSRQEYAKLIELHDEVQAALDEIALDKEELELRSEIGEFEPQEFKKRMGGCRKKLQQKQAEIEAGDELKSRFVAALPVGEEAPPPPHGRDAAPLGDDADIEDRSTVTAGQVPPVPDGVTVFLPRTGLAGGTAPGVAAPAQEPPPPVDDATREIEAPPEAQGEAAAPGATVLLSKEGIEALKADVEAAATAEEAGETAPPAGAPGGSTVILRRAKLVVASGEQADKEYPLGLEGTLLGSSAECDVVFENAAISARHVELSFEAGGYTLRDLETDAGTLVNGEKVEEKALEDGDQIQVGDLEFHFRLV